MLKTLCICNRCGKEFAEKDSKTIKIVSARKERRKGSDPEKGLFWGLLSALACAGVKDYCPDCVNEINEFILNEGRAKRENGID